MTRRSLPISTDLSSDTRQRALTLTDGSPIDYAVQPPPGCRGDLITARPCPRTACPEHLWAQEEIPGRPHNVQDGELPRGRAEAGARPPVRLRVIPQSCTWDVVKANPDGMTADEVGAIVGGGVDIGGHAVEGGVPVRTGEAPPNTVVGERVLQVENRALLKLKAVDHVCAVLEEAMPSMPSGTEIEGVVVHNHVRDPHHHFVTVAIKVREQTAKAGVRVRRKGK